MSDPPRGAPPPSESPPMTPERWQAVNAILEGALACDPAGRDAFVAEACAGDAALHREITSLLAVHDRTGDDFLERPAAEALGVVLTPASLTERLASALEGRYVIERELARGGMATVFVARDVRHDRRVAIKVLRDELAAAVGTERFLEEIRVTASLQHPHILPLFDSGSGNGLLWYVMPFVEGETLRARLQRERRLPVAEAVRLTREMADALEHAHRQGVVHRDVKPENVLIQDGHVLVADFGIALALEHAGGERLTRTGLTLGTPQYMAPEQATGTRTIDARTDVYALGTVLYEMLAGQAPFAASSQAAVLWRTRNEPATALGMTRRDVSSILDAAVQRALAKRPEDRFASAAEFATALGAAAGTATASSGSAPGDTRGAPETEPSHERRVSARAAMYAAAAMLVIGLVAGWMLARSSLPSQVASRSRDAANLITTGANPGTPTPAGDLALTVVDRTGRSVRSIPADRPWTPRFSPDGRRVAYGAFGAGRGTSDLWVTDLATGATDRLTDDDADSNDPQWGPKGATLAFSVSAPRGKDLQVRDMTTGDTRSLATRDGTQFPSDWLRDGSALLVTEEAGGNRHDILIQPADGSPATPYAPSQADETAARISPDGRWVAYTSDASGRPEVYLDAYPTPGQRVLVSSGGGVHPVWRGDGRELYYWHDGALVAVRIGAATGKARPDIGTHTELFRAPYEVGVNTMYDVSPDGQRFIIVHHRD